MGRTMFKAKVTEKDLTIEQPLKDRPDVAVVTLPDGRHRVFGDGEPFPESELLTPSRNKSESRDTEAT